MSSAAILMGERQERAPPRFRCIRDARASPDMCSARAGHRDGLFQWRYRHGGDFLYRDDEIVDKKVFWSY